MTDNIRILTQHECEKLRDGANVPVYGTFEKILEAEIGLGCDNTTPERTAQTVNHETIHETLTELFGRGISFRFDRDLFYNFATCKNGGLCEKTVIRETLIAFFTREEGEQLI